MFIVSPLFKIWLWCVTGVENAEIIVVELGFLVVFYNDGLCQVDGI